MLQPDAWAQLKLGVDCRARSRLSALFPSSSVVETWPHRATYSTHRRDKQSGSSTSGSGVLGCLQLQCPRKDVLVVQHCLSAQVLGGCSQSKTQITSETEISYIQRSAYGLQSDLFVFKGRDQVLPRNMQSCAQVAETDSPSQYLPRVSTAADVHGSVKASQRLPAQLLHLHPHHPAHPHDVLQQHVLQA